MNIMLVNVTQAHPRDRSAQGARAPGGGRGAAVLMEAVDAHGFGGALGSPRPRGRLPGPLHLDFQRRAALVDPPRLRRPRPPSALLRHLAGAQGCRQDPIEALGTIDNAATSRHAVGGGKEGMERCRSRTTTSDYESAALPLSYIGNAGAGSARAAGDSRAGGRRAIRPERFRRSRLRFPLDLFETHLARFRNPRSPW